MKYKKECIAVNITNKKIDPSKNKSKCIICNGERGVLTGVYCRDNPNSNDYSEDMFGGTDYMDCWVFIRGNETKIEYEARILKDRDFIIT